MSRLQPIADQFGWVDGQGSIDEPKVLPEPEPEARDHPAIKAAVAAILLEDSPSYVEHQQRLDQARYEIEEEYADIGYRAFAEWSFDLLKKLLGGPSALPLADQLELSKRYGLMIEFVRSRPHADPANNVILFMTYGRLYRGKPPHISREEAEQAVFPL